MTVKLITEDTLEKENFLSATEEEGPYVGQPVAASANVGEIKLGAKGTIADFVLSSTTSGAGAGGGTTTVCGYLASYGDDFFIGATLAITGGACNGESQTITDFVSTTGTLTHAAFTAQIAAAVTFTLTIPYATRDTRAEITISGDVGDGKYKWTHDGGTTYFGREDPQGTTEFSQPVYAACHKDTGGRGAACCVLDTGEILVFYLDNADNQELKCEKTSDGHPLATTDFGSQINVYEAEPEALFGALQLKSGRVLVYHRGANATDYMVSYSDDDGDTWVNKTLNMPVEYAIEIGTNVLIGVYGGGNFVRLVTSVDGGLTYSTSYTSHTINGDAASRTSIVQAANGNIVIAYTFPAAPEHVEAAISNDMGGSFLTTDIQVATENLPAAGDTWSYPCLIKDDDGTLYCYIFKSDDTDIFVVKSTDHGVTWDDATNATSYHAEADETRPCQVARLRDGRFFLLHYNITDDDVVWTIIGKWEVFAAATNDAPVAIESMPQELVCGIELIWHGRDGRDGDIWTIGAEHQFAAANIIDDSPQRCFRTTQDNIACNIVIDMGAAQYHYATGVGFFGCNVRTLDFQMNATDAWGAPTVDETVSFDLASGTVDTQALNIIYDAAFLANYRDHELCGNYIRMLDGVAIGITYKIVDNVGIGILTDGNPQVDGVLANDTFVVFQPHVSTTFSTYGHRYLRIAIGAQQTAEDYYQIGTMVAGYAVSLTRDFAIGYRKIHKHNVEMLRSPHGSIIPVRGAGRQRTFELEWPASENATEEVVALVDYAEGKNICLIPSTATECYLVKLTSNAEMEQVKGDKFNLGPLIFEEVL